MTITAPEYPADAGDPDVSPETDGEFVRIERLTADITIPSTYNSNGLYVEFYAVDWAGNILSDETIADRTAEFSIDMTAPAFPSLMTEMIRKTDGISMEIERQ